MIYNGTALIQAVGLVYQAATATTVISTTIYSSDTGGLLQSLVPTPGTVNWTTTTTMSPETPSIEASAFLLVAFGIRTQ